MFKRTARSFLEAKRDAERQAKAGEVEVDLVGWVIAVDRGLVEREAPLHDAGQVFDLGVLAGIFREVACAIAMTIGSSGYDIALWNVLICCSYCHLGRGVCCVHGLLEDHRDWAWAAEWKAVYSRDADYDDGRI